MGSETAATSWTVTGTNSKIIVGDGLNDVTFEARHPVITGTGVVMDVVDRGKVVFQSSSIPTTLGALHHGTLTTPGSTIEYSDTAVTSTNQNIIQANYCNLILSGSTIGQRNFPIGTVNVSRTFNPGGFTGATQGTITFNGSIVTQTVPADFHFWRMRINNTVGSTNFGDNVYVDSLFTYSTNAEIEVGKKLILGTSAYVASPSAVSGQVLTVNGTLENNNAASNTFLGNSAVLSPYLVFGPNANYDLKANLNGIGVNVGQIPPATWNATSNINITNATMSTSADMAVAAPAGFVFGNINFDAPNLGGGYRLFGGFKYQGSGTFATPYLVNLLGSLNLGRSNGHIVELGSGLATQHTTFTIAKNLSISDGFYRLLNTTSGTQYINFNVNENVNITNASQLILAGPSGGSNAYLNVGGNFSVQPNSIVTELASGTANRITFNKSGIQTLTCAANSFENEVNFIVDPTSTTRLGTASHLTVNAGAYINLLDGGILDIAAGDTLTINGTINRSGSKGTISGTSTSDLVLGGSTALDTIYFTPAAAVLRNFTLNRTSPGTIRIGEPLTAPVDITLHGTLSIGSATGLNDTLDLRDNRLLAGGSFATSIHATGFLKTVNTNAAPIPAGYNWGGTVWYNSTAAQTMVNGNFNNLTATNGNRTLSSTGTIGIAGVFTPGAGSYTIDNSTVDFNGSVNQNIPGFTFENLVVSNGATTKTLTGHVNIRESLSLNNSTTLQLSNSHLTLISTATKTARLNPVTGGATIAYGGTGRAIPQRYYQARRSWRLVAAPLVQAGVTGLHSISEAWQERGNSVAGLNYIGVGNTTASIAADTITAGFGTLITGGTTANGFDQSPTNSSGIKFFNAGNWPTPANTNNTAVNSQEGWMVFVRGDRRSYGEITTQYKTPTVTTLRPRGEILIGSKTVTAPAGGGLKVVGNPYASAVDYFTMTRTGAGWPANPTYYVWDATLGGTQGAGAFVALTWNGTNFTRSAPLSGTGTSTYDNRFIPSGAAIMVDFPNGSSLQINETDKATANTTNAFRPMPLVRQQQMRTVLYTVDGEGSEGISVTDGILSLFDHRFNNSVDENDARKLGNFNENILIEKDPMTLLVIERRKVPAMGDTIQFGLYRMQRKQYQLQLQMEQVSFAPNTAAYLEDLYLKSRTAVNLGGTTNYRFSITTDAGSAMSNRFRLVFGRATRIAGIVASNSSSTVQVKWQVADESNMVRYEVERSADGSSFEATGKQTKATGKTAATDNAASVTNYAVQEEGLPAGEYWYRVRGVGADGSAIYSEAVKLTIAGGVAGIQVYPNPVRDGVIRLKISDEAAGRYGLRLYTASGQLISSGQVIHPGGSSIQQMRTAGTLAAGSYRLEVAVPGRKAEVLTVQVSQ
ncbi:MAG TPA: hypothetical protein PKC39_06540 [Ferruginibacter sp.]|nr:hypothetical protein [Ferruginibacter sp.]